MSEKPVHECNMQSQYIQETTEHAHGLFTQHGIKTDHNHLSWGQFNFGIAYLK